MDLAVIVKNKCLNILSVRKQSVILRLEKKDLIQKTI
jgi:hypothetical protein